VLFCAACVRGWTFVSEAAEDLQPYFLANGTWVGADICTSLPLDGSNTRYMYLFGDTLDGTMFANGSRTIVGMPRNSVGIVYPQTLNQTGLAHTIRPADAKQPMHVGFFTPDNNNASTWYWPTAGAFFNETVYVLAYEEAPADNPLFAFQTVDIQILSYAAADVSNDDPLTWPQPTTCSLPNINNTFTIGNALAIDEAAGYAYLLGGFGSPGVAMMARWDLASFQACETSTIQYWATSSNAAAASWLPFSSDLQPVGLFSFVPSETTLQYHPFLQQWFVLTANTFISNDILLTTAPQVTGPWSESVPIYSIPEQYTANNSFCYAGKAHPELLSSSSNDPTVGEIVFTYVCNTGSLSTLLVNRPELYFPRPVRTLIYNQ
jgi:hypothetical protein